MMLRDKEWKLVNIKWAGAEPDVGIMSEYVDSFDLEDSEGNLWDWVNSQLTSEEEKIVNAELERMSTYGQGDDE